MEDKKGFTLAEILITLTIIGIVAALTIPTLINNINEAQYNAGVKNTYSTLSNAVAMIQNNNQGIVHVGTGPDNVSFRNDFCNVLGCTRTYDDFYLFYDGNQAKYSGYLNQTNSTLDATFSLLCQQATGVELVSAVLNNGSYLGFLNYGDCVNWGSIGNAGLCGEILVDINGAQGPNIIGKDFYIFHITLDNNGVYSIIPAGAPGYDPSNPPFGESCNTDGVDYNSNSGGDGGLGCAYQRIYYPGNMP